MKVSHYERQWEALKAGGGEAGALSLLANRVALSFLDHYYYNDRFEAGYVRLLCDMATHFGDDPRESTASGALFAVVVERLCDDFEEMQADAYNRVMSHVVDFCRGLPEAEEIDRMLGAFGLRTFEDVFNRADRIRRNSRTVAKFTKDPANVVLLSRVTIGADVAITSVILQRLMRRFENASFHLVGSPKLSELFGGCRRAQVVEVKYPRRGGLMGRLKTWVAVREAVEQATGGAGDTLVVDTDSRLTQLGVLPVSNDEDYLFFDSRTTSAETMRMTVSELANHWLDCLLGEEEWIHPKVWLAGTAPDVARRFAGALRKAGCERLVTISLGVGGNERKRIGTEFAVRLVAALLGEPGTVVIMDKGMGESELAESRAVLEATSGAGHNAVEHTFAMLGGAEGVRHGLVAVESSIGEVAALIGESDEFIGYDSACKHIAGALGVPSHTIFAGTNVPRFVWRWRGWGPTASHIIHVDTVSRSRDVDVKEVVTRVMSWRGK